MKTLYQHATIAMNNSIKHYFELVTKTNDFKQFNEDIFAADYAKQMILSGKSLEYAGLSPRECVKALERVKAIKFDIEKGVSSFVYENTRGYICTLIDEAKETSSNFSRITTEHVKKKSYLLPIWQSALNISSKSNLKVIFGSASDRNISAPSAKKIAEYANNYFAQNTIQIMQVKERIERTLEGIIRDLVGRLLFEAVVKKALDEAGIPYLQEEDCLGIEGVIYKFRADFVIPNELNPLAFIEVRKSSSRHASLYAKDKMFSAINWKGKHKKMLGIIVTEGEWTNESLITMAKVFDYVVPVSSSRELAENIKKYLNGDEGILKWIVDFKITENIICSEPDLI